MLDKGCYKDSLLFAVFEYVEGITLKQALANSGALRPIDASMIMAQVLDALAHAHAQGVVHRDIKPANIILTEVGATTHVKVLDFGIGTLVSDSRQLDYKSITLTQETLGTPSYSAPEQLRGEPATPKTDIYVWGLVLLECLTGKPVMAGSSLAAVFHKQLSASNITLPSALAGHSCAPFLRKILNKRVTDRAGNACDLYNEFKLFNFSNIVGDIDCQTGIKQVDELSGINETVISQAPQPNTTLTERKLLTALCIRISIKSASHAASDREVIDAIHRDQKAQIIDTAIRYGAFHVGSLGDMILFYFGYPLTSDNDGRLAARSALELSSELHNRSTLLDASHGIKITFNMGINSGQTTIYADTVPEGETANIAMHLVRTTNTNQIFCTAGYKELVDTYVQFRAIKPVTQSAEYNQEQLYSLVGERQVEAFGFLRSNKNNHALIGRNEEYQQLLGLIANKTKHQTAHIYGDAGIGKSRLIFELRCHSEKRKQLVTQCLPEHKNSALRPILNIIAYQLEFTSLTPTDAVQQLKAALNNIDGINIDEAIAILCSWFSLPYAQQDEVKLLALEVQKNILFSSLTHLLVNMVPARDKVFFIEDLHWADPMTIEFLANFVSRAQFVNSNFIVISTSRKQLPQTLQNSDSVQIKLQRLSASQSRDFILNLFDHRRVSNQVLDLITNRTDGIPLFIEELVAMLKQKALVQHLNGITDFVSPEKVHQVPNSLRESLQQKLDTLIYAKETAQLASAIGREFDTELLKTLSNRSEGQLQIDLNELIESEIIYQQRKIDGDSFIFKHALVRDAAYESQPLKERVNAHHNIVSIIEKQHRNIIAQTPLVYIDHLLKANESEKALNQSVAIGTQLAIDGNFINSMSLIEHSLNHLHRVSMDKRATFEADLRLTYSMLLMSVKGFGSNAYKQNIEKIDKVPLIELDSARQCSVYFSLMINYAVLSQLPEGLSKYREIEKICDIPIEYRALINFANALIFHSLGDYAKTEEQYIFAKTHYDQVPTDKFQSFNENNRKHIPYDLHSAIFSHHALAIIESARSGPEVLCEQSLAKAKLLFINATQAARKSKDPHTLSFFYFHRAQYAYYLGDYTKMKLFATKSQKVSSENNIVTWKSMSTFLLGWILVIQDNNKAGLDYMTAGFDGWAQAGAISHRGWMKALLAEGFAHFHDHEKSKTLLKQSVDKLQRFQEKRFEYDILNIQIKLEGTLRSKATYGSRNTTGIANSI